MIWAHLWGEGSFTFSDPKENDQKNSPASLEGPWFHLVSVEFRDTKMSASERVWRAKPPKICRIDT